MTKAQSTVALGAISGVILMLLGLYLLSLVIPAPEFDNVLSSRIAYGLHANVFALIPLLIMIITVGNERFLSEAIDPTRHAESARMEVDGRVVENTLQQQVLFFVASMALSTLIPVAHLNSIWACAVVYVVARVVFWKGYRLHPLFRAPGMAATGYLNLGLVLSSLYFICF